MKKLVAIWLVLVLGGCLGRRVAIAQEIVNYQQAYEHYLKAVDNYQAIFQVYSSQRTLSAKQKLLAAGRDLLWWEVELARIYTQQLSQEGEELVAQGGAVGVFVAQARVWQADFSSLENKVLSLTSLADLEEFARDWEKRYWQFSTFALQTRVNFAIAQQRLLEQELTAVVTQLEEKIELADLETQRIISNWLVEIENKLTQVHHWQEKAREVVPQKKKSNRFIGARWRQAKLYLFRAQQYQKEAVLLTKEIESNLAAQ